MPLAALAGLLAFVSIAHAAVAPLSPAQLKAQATHVVTGTVLDVSSKTEKSKIEKAKGIHRDKVFTIRLEVKTVSKGTGITVGKPIEVVAWQPSTRIPPLPGPQGHGSIPKKGDSGTFYLKPKSGKTYEPLLPNGIQLGGAAPLDLLDRTERKSIDWYRSALCCRPCSTMIRSFLLQA